MPVGGFVPAFIPALGRRGGGGGGRRRITDPTDRLYEIADRIPRIEYKIEYWDMVMRQQGGLLKSLAKHTEELEKVKEKLKFKLNKDNSNKDNSKKLERDKKYLAVIVKLTEKELKKEWQDVATMEEIERKKEEHEKVLLQLVNEAKGLLRDLIKNREIPLEMNKIMRYVSYSDLR